MQKSRQSTASFSSPLKIATLQKLEEDKKYILKKIHYLFVIYASRASRYAYRQINQKSFMELMTDLYAVRGLKLIKNSEMYKKFVTIYHGKGKKIGMDYQSFLKLLPVISQQFSSSNSSEDELKNLLKHLLVVYETNVAKQVQHKYVQFDTIFNSDTVAYIEKLSSSLYILYKIYFPEEITNLASHYYQPVDECFQKVALFFKEFEIYPKIVNASQLYLIFLQILTSPVENPFTWMDERNRKRDRVSSFGFSKFLEMLLRIAIVSISRLREVQDPEWWIERQKQCLKALFQYIQSVRTKTKNTRYQNVRFSLILYEQYKNEKERWMHISMENESRLNTTHGDFFDMFERMKL